MLRLGSFLTISVLACGALEAACPTQRAIRSTGPLGYSYVYGPAAQCAFGYCGYPNTSVSDEMTGLFWALGFGNPAVGTGIDSGALLSLPPYPYSPAPSVLRYHPAYAAYIDTGWEDPSVDGCIADVPEEDRCTAIVLHDVADENCVPWAESCTALAVLSKKEQDGQYDFNQPGGGTIAIAPLPQVFEDYDAPDQVFLPTFTATVPTPTEGLYLDPACPDPIVGYRVYIDRVSPGGFPFPDLDDFSEWVLPPEGGAGPNGEPIPLDTPTDVVFGCTSINEVFMAYTYVFENGTESPRVEPFDTFPAQNGFYFPCCRDEDADRACAPFSEFDEDCDDKNPEVGPGFAQLCGDGLNNDCYSPTWPALGGTGELDDDNDGLSACQGDCAPNDPNLTQAPTLDGVGFDADTARLRWNSFGPGSEYDVYRGDLSLGPASAACRFPGVDDPFVFTAAPAPGEGWFFLVSLDSTCEGIGFDSAGLARPFEACAF